MGCAEPAECADCSRCEAHCRCDDLYDADELGLDPEEDDQLCLTY